MAHTTEHKRPSRAMSALNTLRTTLNAGPTIPPRHPHKYAAVEWIE